MTSPARRLSSRRGSVSASDPFAKHADVNLNPSRASSSTLTIVRVVQQPSSPQEIPTRRHSGRRPNNNEPPSPRLSFALSSFQSGGSTSPTTSPRLRPSSPTLHHRSYSGSGSGFSKPRLSAEQVYDLAKTSTNPRLFPPTPGRSPAVSPAVATTASTFTPLPDDIYLPFYDRPSEVTALISSPPSAKLFALLQQTFPKNRNGNGDPKNPATWSYAQLHDWLTTTSRDTVPDPLWVMKARRCILSHSELIWERIKGALGVPPELDVDGDLDAYENYFGAVTDDDDVKSDDLEDEGRKARGHWEDWDAIIDSPVAERPSPTILSGSTYGLAIEPLVAASTLHPPPLSLPSSLAASTGNEIGLGDIAEGAEEEEEQDPTTVTANTPEKEEPEIHGIKISTEPSTPSFSVSNSPVEMYPSYPTAGSTGSVSRSASFSSTEAPRRPSFTSRRMSDFGYESDGSEAGYNPVGDRAPGNPLFPSNFARLALGPTLVANNPSLRSPVHPPLPRYAFRRSNSTNSVMSNFSDKKPHSNPNSPEIPRGVMAFRNSRFRPTSDYAITIASGSSLCDGEENVKA